MVEGTGLENQRGLYLRRFESCPFRQFKIANLGVFSILIMFCDKMGVDLVILT